MARIIFAFTVAFQLCYPAHCYYSALDDQVRDACADGDAVSLKALLEEGGDPNAVDILSLFSLFYFVFYRTILVITYLKKGTMNKETYIYLSLISNIYIYILARTWAR